MALHEITLQGTNLARSYGQGATKTVALRDVSLDVGRGEFCLLMGASGSGKSTLLAVLSGLLRPDGGKVRALGVDFWALSERDQERFRRQHFGFIFQGFNLFPALTARQQLELVLRWGCNVPGREASKRAEAMLTTLDLGDKLKLRPCQLSGGEKQRVAIGRALVKDPALCFADEPTSALDWAHGAEVVRLLRDAAHQRGASVLVVSHDSRIIPYADRVFHLEDGRLAEQTAMPEMSGELLETIPYDTPALARVAV
jgi:putative ABC transport system ATP-binding protein